MLAYALAVGGLCVSALQPDDPETDWGVGGAKFR